MEETSPVSSQWELKALRINPHKIRILTDYIVITRHLNMKPKFSALIHYSVLQVQCIKEDVKMVTKKKFSTLYCIVWSVNLNLEYPWMYIIFLQAKPKFHFQFNIILGRERGIALLETF